MTNSYTMLQIGLIGINYLILIFNKLKELIDALIEHTDMDILYALSKTNKNLHKSLNQKDILNRLYQMHLSDYYNNNFQIFDDLYDQYKILKNKLYIFSQMNFSIVNFKNFQDENEDWINETYEQFLNRQWKILFNILDINYINTMMYLLKHRHQFNVIDKTESTVYSVDGYIFNDAGEFCITHADD